MKTIMRCLVVMIFVGTISTQLDSQWLKVGMDSIGITALAVSGTNIFAGTGSNYGGKGNGVFLSTNNGTNWSAFNNGLPKHHYDTTRYACITAFAVSGTNLIAGTWDGYGYGGIFLSTNNGTSWSKAGLPGTTGVYVRALAVIPNGSGGTNIFAGISNEWGSGFIYRSTNNGISWIGILDSIPPVTAFAVSGTNIFVGTHSTRPFGTYDKKVIGTYFSVFLSTDNGASWTGFSANPYVNAFAVTFSGLGDTNLFAGTDYGIDLSTNNGTSWTAVNNGLSKDYFDTTLYCAVNTFAVSGTNLFAGTGNGVYVSKNKGANWTAFNNGLLKDSYDTNRYGSVNVLSVNGSNLFAGTNSGIWRRPLSEMIPTTDSLMVPVAGGTFTAGTTPVTISSFKMEKFEVTYELWTSVRTWALTHGYTDLAAGKNGDNPVGANNPVDSVNWYDVVKWCNARSEKDGLTPVYYTRSAQDTVYRSGELNINVDAVKWTANGYRLPTEAEWEFAARGGNSTRGYTYSGSNTIDSVAWYYTNSGNTTHTVGKKKGNELGIYDMSGNVGELCWDCYGEDFPFGGTTDPKGPSKTGGYLISRGGSFRDGEFCRVDVRPLYSEYDPEYFLFSRSNGRIGFRCVQGSQVSTAVKDETKIPQTFVLAQNYPNPFNPSTTITYSVPEQSNVRLSIFNILGQKISEIVNEVKDAGSYEQLFHAFHLSSGIYFYRIEATSVTNSKIFVETKKMILLR